MNEAISRVMARERIVALVGGLSLLALPALGSPGAGAASGGGTLTPSAMQLNFGDLTLGSIGPSVTLTLTNNSSTSVNITGMNVQGPAQNDFIEAANPGSCDPGIVAPGASCTENLAFLPGALGTRTATISPIDDEANPPVITLTGTGSEGYYEVTATGHVDTFGDATSFGDLSGRQLPAPIISITSTGDNGGYWLLDSLGNVYAFGDATDFGTLSGVKLNKPIVGMAQTVDGGGYWLVASDGGIFAFGDAAFFGSTGNIRLNQPIVGMAPTFDGAGYWLVAADGGIFSFGDAPFFGSTGNIHLNKPIVGMAMTADGNGYWMVATDGGIFSFGDAQFFGSTGAIVLNKPIVGMAVTPDGQGYWLDASDGGIFAFADAPFYGSDGAQGITNSVGISLDGYTTLQAAFDFPAVRSQHSALLHARLARH